MKKIIILTFAFISLALLSSAQSDLENYKGYSDLEIKTEECLDQMFEEKGIDLNELKTIYEDYFSSAQISNAYDPIEKQYQDILAFWEHPTKRFPDFKDKNKVVAIREKLGFTEADVLSKKQLACFTNEFIKNKAHVDPKSSFYVFGSILESLKEIMDISPGILAGSINKSMDKKDLKKQLYQKTVVLMFCFEMSIYL